MEKQALGFFRIGAGQTPPLTDLDSEYYNRNSENFLCSCRTFPLIYNLTQKQLEKQVIEALKTSNEVINKDLYKAYSDNLRKAVSAVISEDDNFDLSHQLQANVSKFAAYKAYHVTEQIKRQLANENGEALNDEQYKKRAKIVFDTFNRYQVAEYNTAVARSRTAKQWQEFNSDPVSNELYPNLKWIASRSADPREEHRKFWGLVLPKNDPFWQTNQPGNLWNCKCDWEPSDEAAYKGNIPTARVAKGLEGNPAETGEVFTRNASYFRAAKPEVGKITYTAARKESLKTAIKKFKNTTVEKNSADGNINIGFNRKGLEHLQHNYFPNKWLRDVILQDMDKVLKSAEYAGKADPQKENIMVEKFYYYKTMLQGKEWYLNIRKLKNGESYLYSMTSKIKKE